MQIVVANVHELLAVLGAEITARARLIAIDGVGRSGKTTLGAQLADAYDATHVDLDIFLDKNQSKFVEALRIDELKTALASHRLVVATGICLLRVLEVAGFSPDVLIYVKRMRRCVWADQDEVDGVGLESMLPVQAEVFNYHRKYQPQLRAAFVLERIDNQ